jgi:hypothetical protein
MNLCTALHKFFLDCGAFADFKVGRAFDGVRWDRDLRYVAYRTESGELQAPDFVVMPDIVGGGAASLARSVELGARSSPAAYPSAQLAGPAELEVIVAAPPRRTRRWVVRPAWHGGVEMLDRGPAAAPATRPAGPVASVAHRLVRATKTLQQPALSPRAHPEQVMMFGPYGAT